MADQAGIEYLTLLECGHLERHAIDGALKMECRQCARPYLGSAIGAQAYGAYPKRVIVAIETREWHVKCQNCPAGKWTGQDETAAYRFKAAHARRTSHPQIVVDYMVPDRLKRIWKIHYGGKRTPVKFILAPEGER
jgi:hypothetical protein